MSLMIWPIASGLSPSWEWLVTLRVSLMCFVTMFGVSRVPNTLHWMGSQRVLDEEGGPWLIYCPLFSLQLIVSGTILFLPSDSTPLTSEHNLNFQIFDFWWYWLGSEQTNLPDVSGLQSELVTAGGDAEMHGGSIIRGERGGYCGQASADNTFLITMAAHICIYYLIIPSQYNWGPASRSDKWHTAILEQVSNIEQLYGSF